MKGMSLVDSCSHFNSHSLANSPDIVEVKDACVGSENKVNEDDFKRTILLDQWRKRLRAKDFVDQLLEKEEERMCHKDVTGCAYYQPQMQMQFGPRVENGLMMENQFCYNRRGNASGNFQASNTLSASTPTLSTSANSYSTPYNASPNWNVNFNPNLNWANHFPQS
ncbi:unnamed protein product [Rodentolepis nana]|uniref:Uncharacterized protein n=1 Tax=Rodentolepis nana TaxID=102285 RepID=A0A0R3TW60_RODNA|nr:unnamed protein product [Rodentolepis nana]